MNGVFAFMKLLYGSASAHPLVNIYLSLNSVDGIVWEMGGLKQTRTGVQ